MNYVHDCNVFMFECFVLDSPHVIWMFQVMNWVSPLHGCDAKVALKENILIAFLGFVLCPGKSLNYLELSADAGHC